MSSIDTFTRHFHILDPAKTVQAHKTGHYPSAFRELILQQTQNTENKSGDVAAVARLDTH